MELSIITVLNMTKKPVLVISIKGERRKGYVDE